MRQPDIDWDEYDWEEALREGDQFASRYFRLLQRFCDLPGSNELIAKHLAPEFELGLKDCDFDCESCSHQWECEFAASLDWGSAEAEEPPEDDEGDGPDVPPGMDQPGDSLFFESDSTFVMLRQAALGWCNIYAVILPSDSRVTGLRILFNIGRSLANLAYSIDDGLYEQPAASIAFAKRALSHLNEAIGLINTMIDERPRLESLLGTIRTHLIKASDGVVDHLHRCREKAGPETT